MDATVKCEYCHQMFPLAGDRCPHCARPGLFPNMRVAESTEEEAALEARYQEALRIAAVHGVVSILGAFEAAVADSKAIISRPLRDVERLASSDNELYATYYDLLNGGVKLPDGEKWSVLRVLTDAALFPGYKEQIRFGALSLTPIGVRNYGDCSLVIRSDMIAHRATVFEENSVVWMERQGIKISEAHRIPHGSRASWKNRGRLAVVKLATHIHTTTQQTDFPDLLLVQGATTADDDFIEVHIYGTLTVRSLERITVTAPSQRAARVRLKALTEKLRKTGVVLEVQ